MTQTDFLQPTSSVQQQNVRSLNENMRSRIDQEYHWFADFPYVEVVLDGREGQEDAKVMAVKYPISGHSGILVMPDEDREYYEVGWADLQQDDIVGILKALPDEE